MSEQSIDTLPVDTLPVDTLSDNSTLVSGTAESIHDTISSELLYTLGKSLCETEPTILSLCNPSDKVPDKETSFNAVSIKVPDKEVSINVISEKESSSTPLLSVDLIDTENIDVSITVAHNDDSEAHSTQNADSSADEWDITIKCTCSPLKMFTNCIPNKYKTKPK